MITLACYLLTALLGGVAFALLESRSWRDLRDSRNARHLASAGLAGLAWCLYCSSPYSLPSAIVAFMFGWLASSLLESILRRARRA